ncbi:MAG: ribosomal RNA small subunit methyltransferase I, partial [Nitrososphaerota archaeon]
GTPLISDPGYNLVRAAIEAEIQVVPIPGVTALICALSVSGLKSDSFIFLGFLPRKSMARKKLLASLIDEPRTLIFYESPHRLMKSLQDIAEVFGNRDIVIARELTKKFEEILRGPAPQVLAELQKRNKIKGEFVILISGEKETIFGKQEQRK